MLEKLPRTCADLDVFSYGQIQNPSSLFFSASQASPFPNMTMCLSIGDSWDDHLVLLSPFTDNTIKATIR